MVMMVVTPILTVAFVMAVIMIMMIVFGIMMMRTMMAIIVMPITDDY